MSRNYEISSFQSHNLVSEKYSVSRENAEIRPSFSGLPPFSVNSQKRPRTTALRRAILMNEENWFAFRARRWKMETGGMSSVDRKVRNASYQAIIRMGMRIVPLILEDLRREPNHWFPALKIITGQSPVPLSDRGDVMRMRDAWLNWGFENGFLVR